MYDVVIGGGGLAGLTLALQVRQRLPALSVLVIERQTRPLPDACHKVGESSVEIGAHYFEKVLGLRANLDARQLRKNGLRFLSGPHGSPLFERCEIGPSEQPKVPSFQLDRGRFENDLRQMVVESGAELREGWGVRDIEIGTPHKVAIVDPQGQLTHVEARFFADATGRRRLIQKKLGLHRDAPAQASASWFRIKGRLDVAELVPAEHTAWHARDVDRKRWLSTVHLCGKGYWAWLIPLATDHWSVGIVCEDSVHDYRTFSKPETARSWLMEHEPHLGRRLEGVPFEDFIAMKDYRHDSVRVMSADRWSCVGEAGVFVDPLYSPGSDFIGVTNSLTVELIEDDVNNRLTAERADELNRLVLRFEDLTTATLARGSCVFGAPEVTAAKLYWDYTQYWSFPCQYFFQKIYHLPVEEHRVFTAMLDQWIALNDRVQRTLQAWAEIAPAEAEVPFCHTPRFPSALADLHLDLMVEKDPERTRLDMERAYVAAEQVAIEIALRALRRAGPTLAGALAQRIDLKSWDLRVTEERFLADEAEASTRRKMLPPIARDMERAIGRQGSREPAPLRELLSRALG